MRKPPFQTTNEGLAFALMSSGFKPVFLANKYNAERLAFLGYDPAKWAALDAVKDARKRGKPGAAVQFYFDDTPQLQSCVAAWNQQGEDYDAGRQVTLKRPTPEDMMKMARQLTQAKKAFRDSVMGLPAFFEHREGQVEKVDGANGEFTLVCPGFIMASEDLSPEKAARLGL